MRNQSTPDQAPTIRPGDVIDIPDNAGRRLHVVSTTHEPGDDRTITYGTQLMDRLGPVVVEVDLGNARRAVPLVVPAGARLAVPLLPLVSWRQSRSTFGADWPDAGAYREPHAHQHERCGHITGCSYPPAACQAYESHPAACPDCRQAALALRHAGQPR